MGWEMGWIQHSGRVGGEGGEGEARKGESARGEASGARIVGSESMVRGFAGGVEGERHVSWGFSRSTAASSMAASRTCFTSREFSLRGYGLVV